MANEDYGQSPDTNSEVGQCISCGFFVQQVKGFVGRVPEDMWKLPPEQYREIEMLHRQNGTFQNQWPRPPHGTNTALSLGPVCFRRYIDLDGEINKEPTGHYQDKVLAVTRTDRKCPKWYPYTPGLSPGQHLEEFQTQQLEQDRREFERKLVQMQMDADRKIGKVGVWIGVAAVILALAQVGTVLLGLTSESWVVQLFR